MFVFIELKLRNREFTCDISHLIVYCILKFLDFIPYLEYSGFKPS
jgi:hypothetical protein